MADIAELGSAYWLVIVAGAMFTLARFSEAFLVIRAQVLGLRWPGPRQSLPL